MEIWRQRSEGEDLKKKIQSGRLCNSKRLGKPGKFEKLERLWKA